MLKQLSNLLETARASIHTPFDLRIHHFSSGNHLHLEIVDTKAITRIEFYEIVNDLDTRVDFVVSFQPLYSASRVPNHVDSICLSDLNDQFVSELLRGFVLKHSRNTQILSKPKSSFDDVFFPKF
jgi:hypothetical protein